MKTKKAVLAFGAGVRRVRFWRMQPARYADSGRGIDMGSGCSLSHCDPVALLALVVLAVALAFDVAVDVQALTPGFEAQLEDLVAEALSAATLVHGEHNF